MWKSALHHVSQGLSRRTSIASFLNASCFCSSRFEIMMIVDILYVNNIN